MNSRERDEVMCLPEKYRPLGAWGYFGYQILFTIPFVGFICLIVFACSSNNIARRNFARSYFCGVVIVAIVLIVALIIITVAGGGLGAILDQIRQAIPKG